jgi:glutamine amidotransferase
MITIVDYSSGNANSILRALNSIGAEGRFSRDRRDIAESDFIILPGVGHAGAAKASIERDGLLGTLEDAVLTRKVPVMGICLGMQLMVDYVEEGDCAGLGWVRGRAIRLEVRDRVEYKVPHIGWNSVHAQAGARLLPGSEDGRPFYFCHKYTVEGAEDARGKTIFRYESEHLASFEKDNIFGVQFHPEKSHDAGRKLFQAFLSSRG